MEPVAHDTLVFLGGPVKALGEGRVGGYLVRFTTPDDPDLTGEFFTRDTDLDVEDGDRLSVYYHHGGDGHLKNRKIGRGTAKFEDVGLWIEAQLSLRDDYERALYDLARQGKLGWSSGAVGHLTDFEQVGKARWIKAWPVKEASLTPTPAEPRNAALPVKSLPPPPPLIATKGDLGTLTINVNVTGPAQAEPVTPPDTNKAASADDPAMEPNEKPTPAPSPAPAPAPDPAPTPPAPAPEGLADAVKAAVAEAMKAFSAPTDTRDVKGVVDVPAFNQHTADVGKYDHTDPGDLAFLIGVLGDAHANRISKQGISHTARKALALRLHGEEGRSAAYTEAKALMAAKGLTATKANELNYSTQASYGDEWVTSASSGMLWDKIRNDTVAVQRLPQFEFPAGAESYIIPVESTDPIAYKVAQATSVAATDHGPAATVPSSKLGTDNETMTLAKMGMRVLWTGEMEEDSMLPFVAQLRRQMTTSFAEYLDSAVIDGDTETAATTNINDIAGTPASTDYFLTVNGFRKLALVTNTANSRSAGTLTSADFLETVKLMGTGGMNARDKSKISILLSEGVMWKALELEDVKTLDVFGNGATITAGDLTRIWGYEVLTASHMHLKEPYRHGGLANTAGKVDQDTSANNTTGSILAVRWDQWLFGWRRRMTLETQRIARADTTEIVGLLRFGLLPRDSEASAISYGVTV